MVSSPIKPATQRSVNRLVHILTDIDVISPVHPEGGEKMSLFFLMT